MATDTVQALPLGTRLGDYRLDAVIGRGGFGITYRAFDTQLAKLVAIKEYLPVEFAMRRAEAPGRRDVVPRTRRVAREFAWGRERFLDEACALARLRHPNIVAVLRHFEANGTAYTVMQFEEGSNLAQLLRDRDRRFTPPEVQSLTNGLLGGLAAVHAQGFLHRDIEPSNIIARTEGAPVLIDFGAARQAMVGGMRDIGGILAPHYAPIEQYTREGRRGPWSDIYSAAAVLHHVIAGDPPPQAASRIANDSYRPLAATHADRFAPGFLSAIDRALAFSAEQRPQTVQEWNALFDVPPLGVADRPIGLFPATRGLGGVRREQALMPPPVSAPAPRRERRMLVAPPAALLAALLVVATLAALGWRYEDEIGEWRRALAALQMAEPSSEFAPAPVTSAGKQSAQEALIQQATRAAEQARAVFESAEEAAVRARALAGEARIAAARAGRPDLQKAERIRYGDGATFIGQSVAGKRQGLGVAELKDGERQAGEWVEDRLHGLGTVRFADDLRYAGQWRQGQPTGIAVRERVGVERAEGTFVAGRLEGPALRRTSGNPEILQAGIWQTDSLEGPGVETIGGRERYEGTFRGGRRHGFGFVTGPDGVGRASRWREGQLVEAGP